MSDLIAKAIRTIELKTAAAGKKPASKGPAVAVEDTGDDVES